ncbi:major facilitator superfamily protein [Kipferlia bialata]|uniref:Lysosomal dipeptide transporter MFSD1 n=1 Tax=Kipferlia bialata TaxID=797122 RepID=A0A9K3CQG6_9EUKA|nr:major facilitator superfamily protein [Kipferlia bialata]|eukprot:g2243.t1
MMYSVYSFSNFLSVCFGGYAIDKLGHVFGGLTFQSFVCVGLSIFSAACANKNYLWILIGRGIYGVGLGNLTVCQNAVVSHNFKGKELALAFGLVISFSRLGSVLNFYFSSDIAAATSISFAVWLGTAMSFFSFLFVVVFTLLNRRRDRYACMDESMDVSPVSEVGAPSPVKPKAAGRKIKLEDVKSFRLEFWLVGCITALFYACIFPFVAIATDYMQEERGFTEDEASSATGVIYLLSMFFSPFLGKLIDRIGKRLLLTLIAASVTMCAHVMLVFTPVSPWVVVFLIGCSYTVTASSIWSCVPLVVRLREVGTALSLVTAIQMGFISCINAIVGIVKEKTGYPQVSLVFCSIAFACVVLTSVTIVVDKRRCQVLNGTDKSGIFSENEEKGLTAQDEA